MGTSNTFSWTSFHGDLSVYLGLLLLAVGYWVGVEPLRPSLGGGKRFPRGQAATFFTGLLVILLALQSPLHDLSERYLLSAHMVQHLLLTLVAAPLLLLGAPAWLLRPLLGRPRVASVWRVLTMPVVAFVLYSGASTLSHLPVFYDLALQIHGVHVVQHVVYLSTAILVWWPILSPLPEFPRLEPGVQLLYVFAQTLPAFAVGAVITFSQAVIYPTYAAAPRILSLAPLEDQALGGLIMWIGGGLYYLFVLTVIFFRWANREEAEFKPSRGHVTPPAQAHTPGR